MTRPRLLLDENLSPKLVRWLGTTFPDARHISEFGLTGGSDESIWQVAATEGFTIVSKDSDFYYRSLVRGTPPRVIWLRVGNRGTAAIAALLEVSVDAIVSFEAQDQSSVLVLTI
ncbi:DUF5615 family PIN-like protein [soil metagenome]